VQARGLNEHHGLWQNHGPHLLTQLYATRNIAAANWLNALMGGLPHHGAHHAFPWIPSSRLPQATARIASVLGSHQLPEMPRAGSYWAGLRQTAADKAMPLPSLATNSGSQP
jgi:fatty acid desaturase